MTNKWTNLFLLILGLLIALYFYNRYEVAPEIQLNQLQLQDEKGSVFKFESLKGKKLVVAFYASWCGNCIEELKEINKIRNSELRDVEIICITDESLDILNDFKNKTLYPFTFIKLKTRFSEIGIFSIPVTYIVNQDLKIVKEQVGYLHWDDPSTLNHIKGLF